MGIGGANARARGSVNTPPIGLAIAYLIMTLAVLWVSVKIDSLLGLPFVESPILLTLGSAVIAMGFAIRYLALRRLLALERSIQWQHVPRTLVEDGVFRYSRNPAYLGILLMLLGAFIFGVNWPMLVVLVALLILLNRQASVEEKVLTDQFGESYLSYRKRTRRWL
jgi:protein-S-isoprenylcysteine O-methyltransferase Ste14